jgi:hypothetical protein
MSARFTPILLLICLSCYCPAAPRADVLPVRLYDYAGLAATTLAAARAESARILSRGGIEIAWIEPPADQLLPPDAVVVNILPPERSRMWPGEGCGFALRGDGGGPGNIAGVFTSCLDRSPSEGTRGRLVGMLIAHEVGHLLIGPGIHTAAGIMKAHWSRADMAAAGYGSLMFHQMDAGRLRAGLEARRKLRSAEVRSEESRQQETGTRSAAGVP